MPYSKPAKYTKHIGIRVTPEMKIKLMKMTSKERKTITDILRLYLEDLLKQS
ncbi:MAG: hypothetical protein KKB31_00770 [Nanoarchaeota archaeon]|nr:hypothetical protein [Nanoarchaeota archaeon]